MRWFWLLCLTAGAVSDMRERKISCRLLAVCGSVGLICAVTGNVQEHIPGIMLGAGLLALSRLTGGAIGEGDGWFFLVSACYLTRGESWILLAGGLGVSWIWSMGLILYKAWKGETARNERLPLLACMWPAGVWIVL